ncbi:cysteine peptidase family C39 domain-containing protein [Sulfobacillus thermosulfidooxidans]|uniref:cysteine peptidase family C39 domain-containing protein n=1 Tax=Sulfobacillus thermosulfidooxidans TaxID=28034 RepID=UPI0006B5C887|nr:cysteine peptidase family C39 domain-containing protein [Sulfobacillus thermosulfidooxidans]
MGLAKKSMIRLSDVPFHFQLASNDCAPACVLAIAEYYGISISLDELRRRLVTDPDRGTLLKYFSEGLSDIFDVSIGRQSLPRIEADLTPFIAFFSQQAHFVVVWHVHENGVTVGDPGVGVSTLSLSALLQHWDGITIVLRPRPHVPRQAVYKTRPISAAKIARELFRGRSGAIGIVAVPATLLGISNAFFSMIFPYYLSRLHLLALLTAAFILVDMGLSATTSWAYARSQRDLSYALVHQIEPVFERINKRFYTLGDGYTRFQDIQSLVGVVLGLARDLPYTVVIWIGAVGYLGRHHIGLVLVLIGLMILLLTGLTPFVLRVRDYLYQIRLRSARLNNELRRFWDGTSLDALMHAWDNLIQAVYRQTLWGIPVSSAVSQTSLLGILVVALLVGLGGDHAPYLAPLLSVVFLVNYVTSASHSLYQKYVAWQIARPSVYRLFDF